MIKCSAALFLYLAFTSIEKQCRWCFYVVVDMKIYFFSTMKVSGTQFLGPTLITWKKKVKKDKINK